MHDAPSFLFITIQIGSFSLCCDNSRISLIYVFPDGCNTTNNRLYYDSVKYIFEDRVAGSSGDKCFDVTQVRPNDGQNLEETIAQPSEIIKIM